MKLRSLALLIFLAGCGGHSSNNITDSVTVAAAVPDLNFSVGSIYQHDTTSYTEGLLFHDHQLFESSGANPEDPRTQRSMAGIVNMKTVIFTH
ncbi:glutaminyl-peptide cyclotransferase [Puia sp.]|uniref:glutaminyl-peptide cyclotransferase n=1 Tax=Puia sp. TaxID=2045100 RepID=UPI0039C9A3C9